MRNWNFITSSVIFRPAKFIDYLWGIETPQSWIGPPCQTSFIDYLWGIETLILHLWLFQENQVYRLPMRNWNASSSMVQLYFLSLFIDYLWGIETIICNCCSHISKSVYRLPMRNWNCATALYGTYKDVVYRLPMRNWNVRIFAGIGYVHYVYRLPMRNWNCQEYFLHWYTLSRFIDYLWGIETLIDTFNISRPEYVYRLPMRNWNPYPASCSCSIPSCL